MQAISKQFAFSYVLQTGEFTKFLLNDTVIKNNQNKS